MLAWWTELLPVFIFKWMAKRYCERVPFFCNGISYIYVTARKDILININK